MKRLFFVSILCSLVVSWGQAQTYAPIPSFPAGQSIRATILPVTADAKSLYLPYYIYDGAAGNYFTQTTDQYASSTSRFSTQRMKATDNFAFLWESGYGNDPSTAATGYKVNVTSMLTNLESMYAFYRDSLKFVEPGHSLTDQYKMVAYLFYDKDFSTVFGSGSDNKIGVILLYPSRIQYGPYGALAHELGHAFQYMVQADGHPGLSGTAWEMTSQYMLWQYYPTWPTFESYHVTSWLSQTHLAFMHPDNQYHSPFVLEYWADLHGKAFIGQLWRQALTGEDFVMAYKRICGMTQAQFCDEMFNGARHFVTWDLKRGSTIKQFANQHKYKLNNIGNGWFQVPASNAPQNYGYNAVRLNIPSKGRTIVTDFTGLTEGADYHFSGKAYAGWRYGFVVQKRDGSREYSPIYADPQARITYTVPDGATYLWFVVMGAPKMHWAVEENPAQWPYKVRFGNTNVYGSPNNYTGIATASTGNVRIRAYRHTLSVEGLTQPANISIMTIDGSLIHQEACMQTAFTTTLPSGEYIVRCLGKGENATQKVIIP